MKKYIGFIFLPLTFICACKSKNKPADEFPISAVSIIKGQIRHLDTSLYQFTRYETINSRTDTGFIRREEATRLAADFLTLPDITQKDYPAEYSEERLIDAGRNALSITATAKKENAEIQKQIIIINLDNAASGNVNSIFIDRFIQVKDSSIEQKLFWEVDKFFQVGNIIQVKNQPEISKLIKVAWE